MASYEKDRKTKEQTTRGERGKETMTKEIKYNNEFKRSDI